MLRYYITEAWRVWAVMQDTDEMGLRETLALILGM